jgi:hypothetical protein
MQPPANPDPSKRNSAADSPAGQKRAERRQEDLPVALERRGEKSPPPPPRPPAPVPRERKIPVAGPDRRTKTDMQVEPPVTDEETSFVHAMERYKRENRRPFPTWSEVLEVLRSLGYRKVEEEAEQPENKQETPALPPKG